MSCLIPSPKLCFDLAWKRVNVDNLAGYTVRTFITVSP